MERHCQSAAHIKSAGGCGRIRTLRPLIPTHWPLPSPCMYLWCALSRGLPYVSVVSPTCMDISPDDTRESPLSSVIYNPRCPVCTQPPKLVPLVPENRRQDWHVSLSGSRQPRRPGIAPPSGTCRLHFDVRGGKPGTPPPLRITRGLHS